MGKIIGGINGPLIPRLVMRRVTNTIKDRVSQIHVTRGHVDFRSQHPLTIRKFTLPHFQEKRHIFRCAPISVGAIPPCFSEGAPILSGLVGGEVTHIGQALIN